MIRSTVFALCVGVILALSGCAARSVSEEGLPTLVPTLDPEQLVREAAAAIPTPRPTATNTPLPPTAEPDAAAEEAPSIIEYGGVAVTEEAATAPSEEVSPEDADTGDSETVTTPEPESAPEQDAEASGDTEAPEAANADEPAADEAQEIPEVSEAVVDSVQEEGAPPVAEPGATITETEAITDAAPGIVVESVPEIAVEPTDAAEAGAGAQEPMEAVVETETAESADAPPATPEPTAETEPTVAPEPTAVGDAGAAPDTEAEGDAAAPAVDPTLAGMPENLIAAMQDADPDNGELLTLSYACTGCHALDPNQFMAGPTWYNMAETAANRVEGESAGLYLYNSIVNPNDHLVEGYQPNIMLQTYEETIPEEDLADIIAYLLTIRGR